MNFKEVIQQKLVSIEIKIYALENALLLPQSSTHKMEFKINALENELTLTKRILDDCFEGLKESELFINSIEQIKVIFETIDDIKEDINFRMMCISRRKELMKTTPEALDSIKSEIYKLGKDCLLSRLMPNTIELKFLSLIPLLAELKGTLNIYFREAENEFFSQSIKRIEALFKILNSFSQYIKSKEATFSQA